MQTKAKQAVFGAGDKDDRYAIGRFDPFGANMLQEVRFNKKGRFAGIADQEALPGFSPTPPRSEVRESRVNLHNFSHQTMKRKTQ